MSASTWLGRERLELLVKHMSMSSLRMTPNTHEEDERTTYPLRDILTQTYHKISSVTICRALLAALDNLHQSKVHLNGQINVASTYILELIDKRIKTQFEVRQDVDWAKFKNGEVESEAEDIKAVGLVIQTVLSWELTDGSSKERGELHWMRRLAEWMTDPHPHYRPSAYWCCKHHANWETHEKVSFIQAFNEYILSNKNDLRFLQSVLPANHLSRLFPKQPGSTSQPDWKDYLKHKLPIAHGYLSATSGGLKRWNTTLSGKNISHFYQAMRDWEVHADELNPKLQDLLRNESDVQTPTDYLLGNFPELLEYVVFRLVATESYENNTKLRNFLGFYNYARLFYMSPSQKIRHQ